MRAAPCASGSEQFPFESRDTRSAFREYTDSPRMSMKRDWDRAQFGRDHLLDGIPELKSYDMAYMNTTLVRGMRLAAEAQRTHRVEVKSATRCRITDTGQRSAAADGPKERIRGRRRKALQEAIARRGPPTSVHALRNRFGAVAHALREMFVRLHMNSRRWIGAPRNR